jgi:kynureninase
VSLRFTHGYAAMQALIGRGVIGDFRAPDIMRFGFCPLYNSEDDARNAAAILGEIIATSDWDRPEYHARAAVT